MTGAPVSFSFSDGELTVRDEAGGGEMTLTVDEGAAPAPATDAWFDVPVDDAVGLETSSLEIHGGTSAQIRRPDGEHCGAVNDGEFTIRGEAYVDVSAVLKLLVYVGGEMTGRLVGDGENPESLLVTADEPTRIVVGARSPHEDPIATLSVTDDPEDLMTAASYLGSSIKEWSAERSWPTLRGHPPAIERGDELHVPDDLSRPDTGVTVAVPRNTADVLRVTPLAHYFGADVVPGDRAELRLGNQHVEQLGTGERLEQSVDDLLGHALVLDSLVRIGGYYSMPRLEYDELGGELPFYPPELYDEPIHRQLLEYLEVSFDTVRPYVPDWPAVGTLRPTATDAEAVPYLLSTLARVHVTDDGVPRTPPEAGKPVDLSTSLDVPQHVAALPPAARERAAAHERRPAGGASVLFVGFDRPAQDRFAGVDWERFDIDDPPSAEYRPSVTREELRALLREPYAHVHYGNGVTQSGFVCADGVLGFDDLHDGVVGSVTFQWGRPSTAELAGLHDAVSVACLTDESLPPGTAQELAVYLALGRSVATSARLAGVEGVRYLGDATLPVTRRSAGHPPFISRIEHVGPDEYRVAVGLDSREHDPLGRVATSRFRKAPTTHQLAGTWQEFSQPISRAELETYLGHDGIFRFDWCPESEQSPPLPDDLLSK
ncbi:hypothetical protein B4589_010425 [Halolamina sp. CBA1230]|uniref:hypothetical protein n=1 Tax=Halolamina sp. CBA1230 TaxID=1853690 RepID=UPI001179F880|nr:hypothetical protein [Halolamina sp. CBA1230]QKY20771.1 hypothetical protein B4589_010425 [Halolamina sp. CBA1230]